MNPAEAGFRSERVTDLCQKGHGGHTALSSPDNSKITAKGCINERKRGSRETISAWR